jgi:hypothetical protein
VAESTRITASLEEQRIHISHTNSKENVWCGVISEKVYGPFFFEEEAVRAVNYLDLIEQYVVLQLKQDGILDTIIDQQDGAHRIGLS